ncbi:unnamed protein product [Symbiodinium sp. KB8]|nr:unnamed protein product [Symbiodinium sp. KB8]
MEMWVTGNDYYISRDPVQWYFYGNNFQLECHINIHQQRINIDLTYHIDAFQLHGNVEFVEHTDFQDELVDCIDFHDEFVQYSDSYDEFWSSTTAPTSTSSSTVPGVSDGYMLNAIRHRQPETLLDGAHEQNQWIIDFSPFPLRVESTIGHAEPHRKNGLCQDPGARMHEDKVCSVGNKNSNHNNSSNSNNTNTTNANHIRHNNHNDNHDNASSGSSNNNNMLRNGRNSMCCCRFLQMAGKSSSRKPLDSVQELRRPSACDWVRKEGDRKDKAEKEPRRDPRPQKKSDAKKSDPPKSQAAAKPEEKAAGRQLDSEAKAASREDGHNKAKEEVEIVATREMRRELLEVPTGQGSRYDFNGDGDLSFEEFFELFVKTLRRVAFDRSVLLGREIFVTQEPGKVWDVYHRVKTLGEGSFGSAHLGKHKRTKEERVIKVVEKSQAKLPVEDIEKEIMVLRQVDHPHIIRLHEWYEGSSKIYLVMDAIKGGTLREVLLRFQAEGAAVEETWSRSVMKQTLQAMAYCHGMRIIHKDLCHQLIDLGGRGTPKAYNPTKDLKDENVMLLKVTAESETSEPFVVIIDLGATWKAKASAVGHGRELITWWHEDSTSEKRELQPEEDRRVVRSPFFEVSVWTAADPEGTDRRQKPFPYLSWPRMGRQKWGYSKDDGAEDFDRNHCTCTWAHFLYSTDVWVEVTLLGDADHPNIAEEILVRPRKISEQTEGGYWRPEKSGKNAVKIKIPYSAEGLRFSLEFSWEIFTFRHEGRDIAEIPRNALMLFAEPIEKQIRPEDVFSAAELESKVHYVDAEKDFPLNLDAVQKPVIYFPAGVYAMAWNYHAYLNAEIEWIYLAPGSYVKGAIQFRGESGKTPEKLRITGAGTISGEKYVYECDKENGYATRPADEAGGYEGRCLKMMDLALEFYSAGDMNQELEVHGITLTNPPFHSFTVYGSLDQACSKFAATVENYHMVGVWYYQTDGPEVPSWSMVQNSFFQTGDDCIKLYWSHVTVRRITAWFQGNGGFIQFGWKPRNLTQITCEEVDVIHDLSRYRHADNCAIVCAADLISDSDKAAAHEFCIESLVLRDIRVEGKCMCPIRIAVQSQIRNIKIERLWIDEWDRSEDRCGLKDFKKNSHVTKYFSDLKEAFLELSDFRIGGEVVTEANAESLGRMTVDPLFHSKWLMGGTPMTMAPEVWENNFGPKCDVWSAGCILYEMLAGSLPFAVRSMNPKDWQALHRYGPDWRKAGHASAAWLPALSSPFVSFRFGAKDESLGVLGLREGGDLSVVGSGRALLQSSTGVAKAGRLLGVLGPSGAGKSTFLSALADVLDEPLQRTGHVWSPTGTISVAKGTAALLAQDDPFFPELMVGETLQFAATLSGRRAKEAVEEAEALLQRVGLAGAASRRVSSTTKGEQRRLAVACALAGELPGARSRALLVDEPTTGLDAFQAPAGRRMWQSMAGVPAFRADVCAYSFGCPQDVTRQQPTVVTLSHTW